ncbi:hypothetical protein FPQ18DRAFT_39429 [Pyronema domesticum]|nr:hypothetical protein FPQ18DRAFT_39429 [Pyronema domesticum]
MALFLHILITYPVWITVSILKRRPELLHEDICGFGPPLRIAITICPVKGLAKEIIGLGANMYQRVHGLQPSFLGGLNRDDILQQVNWSPPVLKVELVVRTIFHEFAQWGNFGTSDLDLYHHFLQKWANINLEDDEGATLLHYAASGDNLPVFMALIQDGANLNCKTKRGTTVFYAAYQNSSLRVLAYLLKTSAVLIPSDISCSQLINSVSRAPNRKYLHGSTREDAKTSILRILPDKKYDITTRYYQPDIDIPSHWEKASRTRNKTEHFSSTGTGRYIAIPFQGIVLKRVEFKIRSCVFSRELGM